MAFAKLNFCEIVDSRENGEKKYSDDVLNKMRVERFRYLCKLENKELFTEDNGCLYFGDHEEYVCVSKEAQTIWEEIQSIRQIIESM